MNETNTGHFGRFGAYDYVFGWILHGRISVSCGYGIMNLIGTYCDIDTIEPRPFEPKQKKSRRHQYLKIFED